MSHDYSIKSSADLEALVKGNTLAELQQAGEYLSIEFDRYEMHKKDLRHLVMLTNFVADLSVDKMRFSSRELKAEIALAIAQFTNLSSLTLWWDDVFQLANLITPIPSLLASRLLTSVCFSYVVITAREASRIAKAFEYNRIIKSFEADSAKLGKSNLVPMLLGNHTLDQLSLEFYYLTSTEFFALCNFFVGDERNQKLKRLRTRICPEHRKFDKVYLKFATMIAEKKVVQSLFLNKAGCQIDSRLTKYVEKVGGFSFR